MQEDPQSISVEEEDKEIEELKKLNPSLLFPTNLNYTQIKPEDQRNEIKEDISKKEKENLTEKADPKRKINQLQFDKTKTIQKIKVDNSIVYDIKIMSNLMVCIIQGIIKVYSLDSLEEIQSYELQGEALYALSLTTFKENPICACGGSSMIIRIIDFTKQNEIIQLIGHKNEIYDLKFHPTDSSLLLSGSKDTSIRLWNIETKIQICIFGGPLGHSAEVLSICWDLTGEFFVSGGIDNNVKIWKLLPKIKKKIEESRKPHLISNIISKEALGLGKKEESESVGIEDFKYNYDYFREHKEGKKNKENKEEKDFMFVTENTENNNGVFKTLIKSTPIFSCNSIHDNYIDCVEFNGQFIISKSVDGFIKEWLPVFNREGDSFYLINEYSYPTKEKIWFVKFHLNFEVNGIFVGNEKGILYLYHLRDENEINDKEEAPYDDSLDTQSNNIIRSIAYSKEYNICAVALNSGEIILSKLK
ncbi:MAG: hypothetical protein MJ252_24315 [archaeon]|nr:hypothetical protein [archaeon]